MATSSQTPLAASQPTPAWAVHAFTFLNSVGTALVTNGIFYITASGFNFTRTQNFHLALWMGVTYVASAYTTQPILGWLRRKHGLSSRGVLALLMVLLASLCLIPIILAHLPMDESARKGVQIIGLWATVLIYSTLTGVLWPIVESYIAGGRRGDDLRKTMGFWNVCWCAAAIPAALISAPMVGKAPSEAIAIMGGVHLSCLFLLRWHTKEPVPHIDDHEAHPPVYDRLLVAFRMLMPMAYTVLTTLTPMLAVMFAAQGIAEEWQPIAGLGWVIPRVAAFALFGFWGGWHGKWWTAVVGGVLIVAGFGIAVTSPLLGSSGTVLPVMMLGLALFGFGAAAVYSGAIYYAMEVHKSDVDAGGTHETLVGIGYTLGPACGLLASQFVKADPATAETRFGPILFGIVGAFAVVWTLVVIAKVRRLSKPHS
jgi:MFS family permease